MKILVAFLLAVMLAVAAQAADLVQLAAPGTTSLTLYPGQTRALASETRELDLPAGNTAICFSWSSGNIDPSSPTLMLPGATVGDAVRPAGQDKTVVWNVNCPQALHGRATVSYFVDGCDWHPSYRLFLNADGQTAALQGMVQLDNKTGMALHHLDLRISANGSSMIDAGDSAAEKSPAALYSVPEAHDLPAGATRAWQFLTVDKIGAQVHYQFQPDLSTTQVRRLLVLAVQEASTPGLRGLPEGPMTIYSPGEQDVPLFTTDLTYQPQQELKVDLGVAPDIVVEYKLMSTHRSNLATDRVGRICGSDTLEDYQLTIRNRQASEIVLELTQTVLSTWELKAPRAPDKTDTGTVEFDLPVPANQPVVWKFSLLKHSGTRAKK